MGRSLSPLRPAVRAMAERGHSTLAIATALGCNQNWVKMLIFREGWHYPGRRARLGDKQSHPAVPEALVADYETRLRKGYAVAEIAEMLGLDLTIN